MHELGGGLSASEMSVVYARRVSVAVMDERTPQLQNAPSPSRWSGCVGRAQRHVTGPAATSRPQVSHSGFPRHMRRYHLHLYQMSAS
jgi:hypothetical protein